MPDSTSVKQIKGMRKISRFLYKIRLPNLSLPPTRKKCLIPRSHWCVWHNKLLHFRWWKNILYIMNELAYASVQTLLNPVKSLSFEKIFSWISFDSSPDWLPFRYKNHQFKLTNRKDSKAEAGSVADNGRWRLVSAQVVSCCVYKLTIQ